MVDVVLLYDMGTRDGRQALEVRLIEHLANAYFCPARKTVYSCAYDTQAGRILAFARAFTYCKAHNMTILTYEKSEGCRSYWQ